MALSPRLLEILVCPRCKARLRAAEDAEGLDCRTCKLRFPVRDEVPVLLLDEAESLG